MWKADLEAKKKQKIAVGIADPDTDADLFGDSWQEALSLEQQGVQDYVPAGQQEDLLKLDEEDAADMVEKLKIGDNEDEEGQEQEQTEENQDGGFVTSVTNGKSSSSAPLQSKESLVQTQGTARSEPEDEDEDLLA